VVPAPVAGPPVAPPLPAVARQRIDSVAPAPSARADTIARPAPDSIAPRRATRPPTLLYTVRRHDSLRGIARRLLGRADRWKEIYQANKRQIRNPDLIQPGQRLVIRLRRQTPKKPTP
jgi:nucleoid-associated protein YgaU